MPGGADRALVSPVVVPIAEDEDFLSQHLSNLLVRQPSSNVASIPSPSTKVFRASPFGASPPLSPMSRKTSLTRSHRAQRGSGSVGGGASSSIVETLTDETDGQDDVVVHGATRLTEEHRTCDDLFTSFFVPQTFSRQTSESYGDGASSTYRTTYTPSVASMRHAPSRGPPSVSMSTSFGARRKVSVGGTDVDGSSDGSSVASSSSMSFGHPSSAAAPRSFPPGMLGRSAVHYQSNETAFTTPPESVAESSSRGELSESYKATCVEASAALSSLHDRHSPSFTLSSGSTSSQSTPASESIAPPSGLPASESVNSSKTISVAAAAAATSDPLRRSSWTLFNEGAAMEPPDMSIDAVDGFARNGNVPGSGRYTSMTSRRLSPVKHSLVAPSVEQDSDSSNCTCDASPSYESGPHAAVNQQHRRSSLAARSRPAPASTLHGRKHSVTLVPSGDDGRTFRFV